MSELKQQLQQINFFLARHGVYPLVLSTGLALGLYAGRVYRAQHWLFAFLVWNLFLAWVPYLSSLWAALHHQRHPRRWWGLLIPGGLWLAFFPNAPYLITDFLHLNDRPPVPLWYDIGMLTAFAWTGLFLGIFSLRAMQEVVKTYVGNFISWLFVLGVFGLGGLGVYMGRFLRWNSWDLLVHPRAILTDVAVRVANPLDYRQTIGVTVLFATFLFISYLTLTSIPNRK